MARFEDQTCSKCGGDGCCPCHFCDFTGEVKGQTCKECKGDLYMECPRCEGSGQVTKNKMIGRSNRKR